MLLGLDSPEVNFLFRMYCDTQDRLRVSTEERLVREDSSVHCTVLYTRHVAATQCICL